MGDAMIEQEGLLNVAQAAIALDRSRERVYELIELGLLGCLLGLGQGRRLLFDLHHRG